ncbi:MAG: AI-2E family transporter [Candidatus Gracilibacteria bacterium]|nr:AI-2E family transporter [Candidatus Gracilibacteria bacterium]
MNKIKKIIKNDSNEYVKFSIKFLIVISISLFLGFLYLQLDILKILFFSSFLLVLFSPFLNKMNKRKIPDILGIFIIYLFFILFLLISLFAIIPIFMEQTYLLVDFLSKKIEILDQAYKLGGIDGLGLNNTNFRYLLPFIENVNLDTLLTALKNNFASISQFIASNLGLIASSSTGLVLSVGNVLFQVAMVFIFNFFMVLERKKIKILFYDIIPLNVSKYLSSREDKIVLSLYDWLKGQFLLAIIMFFIVFISLSILSLFGIDLKNNFTLAIISGLMEFIPYLGPTLALLPALAIAFGLGFNTVLIILGLYLVIQWCENNILVPYIMSKSMDLSPFLVLLMMAIGASAAGILGIILAVPLSAIIQIFARDYIKFKKKNINK